MSTSSSEQNDQCYTVMRESIFTNICRYHNYRDNFDNLWLLFYTVSEFKSLFYVYCHGRFLLSTISINKLELLLFCRKNRTKSNLS